MVERTIPGKPRPAPPEVVMKGQSAVKWQTVQVQTPRLIRAKRDAMRGILTENSEQARAYSQVFLSSYLSSVPSVNSV